MNPITQLIQQAHFVLDAKTSSMSPHQLNADTLLSTAAAILSDQRITPLELFEFVVAMIRCPQSELSRLILQLFQLSEDSKSSIAIPPIDSQANSWLKFPFEWMQIKETDVGAERSATLAGVVPLSPKE